MKKRAFTLAEVLVALAIVGVIAALTLPNIMRLNQEAGIGPMLSSVQTSVEEAAGRMLVDNPNKTLSKMDTEGLFIGYLNRQLAMLDRTNDANPNAQGYALTNGAILNFVAPTGTVPAGTAFKDVVVDINGENRPNANGIDKFTFTLSSNGFLAPQGCAKVISDNNWKVPKDYDPTACTPTAYTPSGGTGGVVADEDCELPKILMPDGTCCNPATDPTCKFAPQTCEPTPCSEPEFQDWVQSACGCIPVRKRCPDGSIIDINANCQSGGEPEGETKTCLNGDVIAIEEDCPVQCWDGNWVQNILDCPIEPSETKTCLNGDVIAVDEDCPVQCWNGSWVQDSADCPAQTKNCDDGSVVNADEDCPVQCWDGSWVQDSANCPEQKAPVPQKDMKFNVYGVSTPNSYYIAVGGTLAEPLPYEITITGRFRNCGGVERVSEGCTIPAGQLSCMPVVQGATSYEVMNWSPGRVGEYNAIILVDGRPLYQDGDSLYYFDTREPFTEFSFNLSSDNPFNVRVNDGEHIYGEDWFMPTCNEYGTCK